MKGLPSLATAKFLKDVMYMKKGKPENVMKKDAI